MSTTGLALLYHRLSLAEVRSARRLFRDPMYTFGMRDFRPRAVAALIEGRIVARTETGRYFLKKKQNRRITWAFSEMKIKLTIPSGFDNRMPIGAVTNKDFAHQMRLKRSIRPNLDPTRLLNGSFSSY